MDKVHTIIKFDGYALDVKTMDVAHLAPALLALLALSDLVKETNRYANGERAGVRVLVNVNLEQKCFELNIELALTIWEKAKLFIAYDRVQTAKEIAECIGIVGGSGYGLFRFIKWVRGRTIESVTVLKVVYGQNMVEIRVEGETDPVKITQSVYELYANQAIRQKAVAVLAPLREKGYDSLEFYEEDNIFVEFQKNDLPLFDGSDLPEVIPQNIKTSTIQNP